MLSSPNAVSYHTLASVHLSKTSPRSRTRGVPGTVASRVPHLCKKAIGDTISMYGQYEDD